MRIFVLIMFFAVGCSAAPKKDSASQMEVHYKVEGTDHLGFVASGAKPGEKKPGIIIVHEWWGHNEYTRRRAKMLAELGYVAMAIDMYGEGKRASHPEEAGAFAKKAMSDFPLARKRFEKALETLKTRPDVDPAKIAAIGYCFGGAVVLNMARAGVDLNLIASFHGSLASKNTAKKGAIKGQVLVFNGKADPFIKKDEIDSFKKEMNNAAVNFNFYEYEGAKHGFTSMEADANGKKFSLPLAYDKPADEDSWNKFLSALKTI